MVGTTVHTRNHAKNQAKKKKRHCQKLVPWNLPCPCEKLKTVDVQCAQGNQCHSDGTFSRGGSERNGEESHMASGHQRELEVKSLGAGSHVLELQDSKGVPRARGQW